MSAVITLHEGLENALWMFFLAIGLWGAYNAVRGEGIDGSWVGAVYIAMALVVVLSVLAGIMWFGGALDGLQDPGIHFLYVGFSVVFPPFVYQIILEGDDSNRGMWVMSFTTLFMFGIAIRLMNTAIV